MVDDSTKSPDALVGKDEKKLTLKLPRKASSKPVNSSAAGVGMGADSEGQTEERTVSRKRYRVTPEADAKPATRSRKPASRRGAKAPSRGGVKKAGGREPVQKKLPDDPDHQWLKKELRAADTVAQVLARQAQFENKIRALKLRHAPERPLFQYAERMEQFLKRLASYPWTAQLRDIRQDDAQIRKLKL